MESSMMGASKVRYITGQRVSRGGQKLHTVEYWPANGRAKALVVFHHGLCEHIGRYRFVGNQYAEAGYGFVGYDAYNHGRSESQADKERGFLSDFDQLVGDMVDYAVEVEQRLKAESEAPVPMFLHGHSMGGLIALHAALARKGEWGGIILNSPLINVEWNTVMRIQAAVAGFLAWAVPNAKLVPAVKPEDMSQDPLVVKDYVEDPFNIQGDVRVKSSYTLMKALKTFISRAGAQDKTLEVLVGGYHELLHGPEKEQCMAKITQWLDGHVGSAKL